MLITNKIVENMSRKMSNALWIRFTNISINIKDPAFTETYYYNVKFLFLYKADNQ